MEFAGAEKWSDMFQRYTEKARRSVFFARYEASQYGNPYIGTEHLLLGLLREDITLRQILNDTTADSEIRREVEKRLVRGEPIPTSVEVPLSHDAKRALVLAAEEADRLGHRHVGTEHMLLGIVRVDGSVGAQLVHARGVRVEELREKFSKGSRPDLQQTSRKPALPTLEEFLTSLKWQNSEFLMPFFADNAQLVDVSGKQWKREDMRKNFEALFVPYAKKNSSYVIEDTLVDSNDLLVVVVLWKNALVASMERVWMHRMSVVLAPQGDDWAILLMQITPVQP